MYVKRKNETIYDENLIRKKWVFKEGSANLMAKRVLLFSFAIKLDEKKRLSLG